MVTSAVEEARPPERAAGRVLRDARELRTALLRELARVTGREAALRGVLLADVRLLLRAVAERVLADAPRLVVRFRDAVLARALDARVDAERRPVRDEPLFAVARELAERRRVPDDDNLRRAVREEVRDREALAARAAVPLRRLARLLPSARASAVSRPMILLKLLFCPPALLSW